MADQDPNQNRPGRILDIGDTDAGRRTFRVWRVRSVELTDEPVSRLSSPATWALPKCVALSGPPLVITYASVKMRKASIMITLETTNTASANTVKCPRKSLGEYAAACVAELVVLLLSE